MAKTSIKALIFDIGGVLFLEKDKSKRNKPSLLTSYKELLQLLKGIEIPIDQLYAQTKNIYMKSTTGEISKKATLKELSKITHLSPTRVEYLINNAVKNNVMENSGLIDYLKRKKIKGMKLGLLSNQWHLSMKIYIPIKYTNLFDEIVVSCEDKIRKPDPRAYQLILQKLGLKPEETVYIDDKEENLHNAKALGMKVIHYKNNKQLYKELSTL